MVSVGRTVGPGDGRYEDVMSVTVGPKPSLGAMDGVVGDRGESTDSEGVSIVAYKGAETTRIVSNDARCYTKCDHT